MDGLAIIVKNREFKQAYKSVHVKITSPDFGLTKGYPLSEPFSTCWDPGH